jgi:hypothetical protein
MEIYTIKIYQIKRFCITLNAVYSFRAPVLIIFAELKRKNKIKTKTNGRNKRKIGYNFDRK